MKQVIYKAGNSNAVTIPSQLMKDLGFKTGEAVMVEKAPIGNGVLVKKTQDKTNYKDELSQWFTAFIKENGQILDELAVR